MFNKGDYVVNSNNGICKIDGIVTMNTPNGNKEYYLLIPLNEKKEKILSNESILIIQNNPYL